MMSFNKFLAARAAARARIRARLDHGTIWTAPTAKSWAVVTGDGSGWKVTRFDREGLIGHCCPPDMAAVVDLLVEHYGAEVVQVPDHVVSPSENTVT
jgi:hypothetical protein